MTTPHFSFSFGTQAFLADLSANNTRVWFDANRDRYQSAFLEPARAFVDAIAPALDELVPGLAAVPRVNGSIFRINRDIRFSKDKTPYKEHLDFWFWQGERTTAISGLFLRIAPTGVIVGAGAHGFDSARVAAYREAVAGPGPGDELIDIVAEIEQAGHTVDGESLSRLPRGFDADGHRARLLRLEALHASAELPAQLAMQPQLISTLVRHWRVVAPLHTWLVTHLS